MLDEIAPASFLTWLDFSEYERRKALDVIDTYRERGTVDELGLGTIRDALADILFPGTSTIQTRARYFLFVPWIYRSLEGRNVPPAEIARRIQRTELRLIEALLEGKAKDGVIGIDSRGSLKRFPSSIYWQGLRTWGIRVQDATQAEYLREFQRYGLFRTARDDDEAPGDGLRDLWHANLPKPPSDFLEKCTFELRTEESVYLRERLMSRDPPSMLAWLVDQAQPSNVAYPWLHPELASLPETLALQLDHARLFSLLAHGPALAYNLYLSELVENAEYVTFYEEEIAAWASEVEANRALMTLWRWNDFRELVRRRNPRIGLQTWLFVERWLARLLASSASLALMRGKEVRRLIEARETSLKHKLARLTNSEPRKRWNGESGAGRMDFRWFRAQAIVNDIVEGLRRA